MISAKADINGSRHGGGVSKQMGQRSRMWAVHHMQTPLVHLSRERGLCCEEHHRGPPLALGRVRAGRPSLPPRWGPAAAQSRGKGGCRAWSRGGVSGRCSGRPDRWPVGSVAGFGAKFLARLRRRSGRMGPHRRRDAAPACSHRAARFAYNKAQAPGAAGGADWPGSASGGRLAAARRRPPPRRRVPGNRVPERRGGA